MMFQTFSQKLNINIKMLIAITLVIAMIFSSSVFAFADDETAAEVPSGSSASVELSESEIEFINNASSDSDREIRKLAVDVVRATSSTYTIDDVYGLLIALITTQHNMYEWKVYDSSIYNQINNNFSHYDSSSGNTYDTGAMLWTIRQTLNDIALELVPAAATNLPSIYELISSIDSTLTNIISAIPQPVDYTSALFYHNIGLAQMFDSFKTNNLNYLYSINNNVSSIDTNTSNIKSNTDTLVSNTNTIHNDLGSNGSIASGISSLNNDFNNISWNILDSTFLGVSSNLSIPQSYINNNTTLNNAYYHYIFTLNDKNQSIFRFYIPLTFGAISPNYYPTVKIYRLFNNSYREVLANFKIEPIPNYQGLYVYVYDYVPFYQNNNIDFVINITYNQNITVFPNANHYIEYITSNLSDYYVVYDYLTKRNSFDILSIFKDLYASDDIIASKEAQKPLEDAVLDDFTGSGSASASIGDAVDVKGVQSSIKGSLNTGNVKASGLSTILNTNNPSGSNSFFSFFTSSVYNDINGINNIPQTRDVYIYLNDRDTFNELVGGQSW